MPPSASGTTPETPQLTENSTRRFPVGSSMTLQHIIDHRDALIAELRQRQAIVRDYVRGVARQYATGLYLFGRPGTAKTHTVRKVLEREIREPYTYQRGHLTTMGLFELIAGQPNA